MGGFYSTTPSKGEIRSSEGQRILEENHSQDDKGRAVEGEIGESGGATIPRSLDKVERHKSKADMGRRLEA